MPFSGSTFTHLFDWVKDPQRNEKIINERLEAEFDGIDTGLSALTRGAASSTLNAAARFADTGGKDIKDSAFIVDDTGHVTSFGGNIAFPATQAASAGANVLDDYDEGTWTPDLRFGGTSLTSAAPTPGSYSARTGRYTKIGNVVCVFFRITIGSLGSANGAADIAGLPFTIAAYSSMVLYLDSSNLTTQHLEGLANVSDTTVLLRYMSGGGANDMTHASFNAGSLLIGSLVYPV